jgi:hypothetical protein
LLDCGTNILPIRLKVSSELKTIFIWGFETKKGDSLRVQGVGVGVGVGVAGQG